MHITLLTIGTRGDVQPLVALGVGLQRTGRHRVRMVAPDNFEALIRSHGLDFLSVGMDARGLLETGAVRAVTEPGVNILLGVWKIFRIMRPLMERMMENSWLGCRDAEAIVFSTMGLGAYHIAKRLDVPCYWALPFPTFARTRAFPNVAFPPLPLGGAYNLMTHVTAEQAMHQFSVRFLNRWRRERLDLPPVSLFKWPYGDVPLLYSFSPILVSRPPDWGENTHVTGYWFLDHPTDWQPPAALVDFLESGSPPIYFGFGSLPQRKPGQMVQIVLDALKQSRRRGVFAVGWSGLSGDDLSRLPDYVFALESIPHSWLFPRMAAVVHHGGSGTTGAGLRAGVPSVIVPHAGDQSLWARRVMELGVGPEPIPRRQLTAERLSTAIEAAVTDEGMRRRAAELGECIRAEDGVGLAVEVIERGYGDTEHPEYG